MTAVDSDPRPADSVVAGWLRGQRGLLDADRGALLDRLNATLRHRARLGWWLNRQGHTDTPRGRLLVWLVLGEGLSPAQVMRLCDDTSGLQAVTPTEQVMLTAVVGRDITDPAMPDGVALEVPGWAVGPLRDRFGLDYGTELAAMLTPPPLDLRVNTIRATRDQMLRALRDNGLSAAPTALAPHGIRMRDRLSLARLDPLKRGDVEIQDEGSQLVALLVDARPGDRVADFCAGAGGKTLAIAAQMHNKGYVAACDVSEGRLKRCAERVRKAGLGNVQTILLASETDRWVKRRKGTFDRVLVDAPCSGTGTWRHNPDARWRTHKEGGLDQLAALQSRILASAARLVKPGGRLVYATCSLLTQENEAQVTAFLAAHPAFSLLPVAKAAPHVADVAGGGYLSLTPARHNTDSFFAAVLQKDAAAAQQTPA